MIPVVPVVIRIWCHHLLGSQFKSHTRQNTSCLHWPTQVKQTCIVTLHDFLHFPGWNHSNMFGEKTHQLAELSRRFIPRASSSSKTYNSKLQQSSSPRQCQYLSSSSVMEKKPPRLKKIQTKNPRVFWKKKNVEVSGKGEAWCIKTSGSWPFCWSSWDGRVGPHPSKG